MRLVYLAASMLAAAAGCGATHEIHPDRDASADDAAPPRDAGHDASAACSGSVVTPGHCSLCADRVPGDPELARIDRSICPSCPAGIERYGAREVDGTPCEREHFECVVSFGGFCSFWGCTCGRDETGELRWSCWVPLC